MSLQQLPIESESREPAVRRPSRRRSRDEQRIESALRERRSEAMALVMKAHGKTVLGFLTRTLGDASTAEDVLQQVLLEVWQRGESYDSNRSGVLTWVMRIARSRAIDELRRRVPEPFEPEVVITRADSGASQYGEIDRLLEQWRIAGLLQQLPREEARLLRMRFYDGLSQPEIAQRTGVALGTVKARMVAGLCQLRELLEAEEAVGERS